MSAGAGAEARRSAARAWRMPGYAFFKRGFDLAAGAVLGVLLLPVLSAAAAVAAADTGSAFFCQERIGKGGRVFRCYKLRTMRPGAEQRLQRILADDPDAAEEWARDRKLRSDPRVSRAGRLLRKTGLDELPQILNVLRGEMSLVGPRPIVAPEIRRYGDAYAAYCSVRPGLTGLWQVSGRNDLPYEQRVVLDARYAREYSAAMDAWILLRTVPAVLSGRGAY